MSAPTTSSTPSRTTGGLAGKFMDPQALMAIKSLELRAKVVVEGFWHGLHRSPTHGFSVEFSEYRQYTPGDDPRYLDWRLFARSDRYYIKKFEDETNLRCHLVVDQSRSMAFGSRGYTKADYANTLAATLAYFLSLQGDAVGLLTFDEAVRDYLPARHRPGHLRHLMLRLDQPASGRSTDVAAPLNQILRVVKKRGLLVLLSDWLVPGAGLEKDLSTLVACGHEVVLFQLLDPAELTFAFDKAVMFEDAETGRQIFIDPALARAEYIKRLEAHNAGLKLTCEKLGIAYRQLGIDRPMELALFDFVRERMGRNRIGRRRAA